MENQQMTSRLNGGINLRKIPVNSKENTRKIAEKSSVDEIKIIELSTAIDKWEKEVLFCENGFYSLKGKDVESKEKEYIEELKNFIGSKIDEISFSDSLSREKALEVKRAKVEAVKAKMEIYVQEQYSEWEMNTCEEALNATIQRAVAYKNDLFVIDVAFNNGLKIIDIIANKDEWNKKLYNYRKKQFVSDFYLALINEFIKEKDIKAYQFFNRYKNDIAEKEREKIEKIVNEMKIKIIANNWAKEIFSYNLDEEEFEKELNNIEDSEIKNVAKQFYFELKKTEKLNKKQEEKEKNIENWKEVLAKAKEDINTAELFIDYSLNKESIKSKKEYIKQMIERGSIITDISTFLKLANEILCDALIFKDKDISNYHGCLSEQDLKIFEDIQNANDEELYHIIFDCKYLMKMLKESEVKANEEKYDCIKMYFISTKDYKIRKKEEADIEIRKKIIESIFSRYTNKKERK